jgi:DnaJ-like protein
MSDPDAFPLAWPAGRARTKDRQVARFSTRRGDSFANKRLSIVEASDRLIHQVELLIGRGRDWVLSTNVRPTLAGLPRSNEREPADPGVAVYFRFRGRDYCLACDRWHRVADNIAAIAAEIEANRGRERWGVVTLEEAFTGFQALPAKLAWWQVLGLEKAPATYPEVKAAYRELARKHHPDAGGDPVRMAEINEAWEEGCRTLGGNQE